jgi:HK97 family phage portal protein
MIAEALARVFGSQEPEARTIGDGDDWRLLTGGSVTAAGERVSPQSALTVAAFYGGVNLIASGVRAMPVRVMRDTGDGPLRPARASRLWPLLHDRANPEMHASELWEWMTLSALLSGNGFCFIQRDRNLFPQWLWPVRPGRVTVRWDPRRRRKVFDVSGPGSDDEVRFTGTTRDVVHVRGFGTDPLVGVSVVQYLRETIGRALSEDRKAASLMRNNGRPAGILTVKGRLDDDAARRLKDRWDAAHAGRRAGGTAVLEDSAEWKGIEMSAADMELVKQRAISREDFAIALQLPGDMLLAGNQANLHYSSDASRDVRLVKYGLMPWAKRIQDALEISEGLRWWFTGSAQGRLVPRFAPEALLRADLNSRYDAYAAGIGAGWLTRNEAREKEDLQPIDGLDTSRPVNGANGSAAHILDEIVRT